MLPLFGIATLTLATIVLRRFIVPLVPIRRHIRKLVEGDYDVRLQLRAKDEVRDIADGLNELSETLQMRHAETSHKLPRIARAAGFSLVELLVVLAIVMILAMLNVAQFITAYDRSRQRGTLADMRTIAAANGTYHVDKGDYATSFEELTPYYLGVLPPIDRWGFAWTYEHSTSTYTLTSPGSDGASGPAAPAGWNGDPFECDLVVWNGAFTQAPATN